MPDNGAKDYPRNGHNQTTISKPDELLVSDGCDGRGKHCDRWGSWECDLCQGQGYLTRSFWDAWVASFPPRIQAHIRSQPALLVHHANGHGKGDIMLIPHLRVTAIKCEGIDAWTVVTVEFEWLNGVCCGDAQWNDAVAAATLVMETEEWQVYWHELVLQFGRSLIVDRWRRVVTKPKDAEAFTSWASTRTGGWVFFYDHFGNRDGFRGLHNQVRKSDLPDITVLL